MCENRIHAHRHDQKLQLTILHIQKIIQPNPVYYELHSCATVMGTIPKGITGTMIGRLIAVESKHVVEVVDGCLCLILAVWIHIFPHKTAFEVVSIESHYVHNTSFMNFCHF